MSHHLTDIVWRHSDHKGSELLILISIADNADFNTSEAYPSMEHIAAKTRLSKGGVHSVIKKLLAGGELSLVRKGTRDHANTYRIEVETLRGKADRLEQLKVQRSNSSAVCVQNGPALRSPQSERNRQKEPSEECTDVIGQKWLSHCPPLIRHPESYFLTSKWQTAVVRATQVYPLESILKAIENYAGVLTSPSHLFSWRYPAIDFLHRERKSPGIDHFVDEAAPYDKFRSRRDASHSDSFEDVPDI